MGYTNLWVSTLFPFIIPRWKGFIISEGIGVSIFSDSILPPPPILEGFPMRYVWIWFFKIIPGILIIWSVEFSLFAA